MRTLMLEVPDEVEFSAQDLKTLLLAHLYERGEVSLGWAAQALGLSRQEFMDRLGDFGVSVVNLSPEDVAEDVETARRYF